jgi:large subunit ribosomal protein L17
MHRHGYQGRKFHREIGPRRALIRGLADSLVIHESIVTTKPKAKELVPYVERLITKAKKGGLHNRRQLITDFQTPTAAHKLMDELAPKLGARSSGYLRIELQDSRRGDNTVMTRVSFVDDLKQEPKSEKPTKTASAVPKAPQKKVVSKTSAKTKAKVKA